MPQVLIGRLQPDAANLTAEFGLGVASIWYDREKRSEVDALIDEERGPTEIARITSVPVHVVTRRIYTRRQNRTLNLPQSRPDPKYNHAHWLWNCGKTIKEIAEECGYGFKQTCGIIDWYRKTFGWFARRNKPRKDRHDAQGRDDGIPDAGEPRERRPD